MYLCTRFQKQTNQRWRQHHKNGNKNMTRELLNKIVKANKINLEHYDHIWATINEAYTFVTICFCNMQVCGGEKTFHNQLYIRMSTAAMMKRGELPEDYETRNIEWIYEIR